MKLYDIIKKEDPGRYSNTNETVESSVLKKIEKKPRLLLRRKLIVFISIISLFIAIIYIVGIRLRRSVITINERIIPISAQNINIEIPHQQDSNIRDFSFQTMKITTAITREVFGSQIKESTSKAKGSVIFFNEFSSSSQTIRSGTRLVGENGKTYQTMTNVTVPGFTLQNKKKIPGTSKSVEVVAVDSGQSFNTQGTTLSVASFSGTKRKTLYARSAGPITGGEAGIFHTVNESEKEELIQSLSAQLTERLKRETRAQIPEGYITYPDLQVLRIDTDSIRVMGEGVRFPVEIKGSMVSYIFPQEDFETKIAKELNVTIDETRSSRIAIPSIQQFSVSPTNPLPFDIDRTPETIQVTITGEGEGVVVVDNIRLKSALINMPRKSFKDILTSFPDVQKATYTIYPFWAPFFPETPDKIILKYK